MVWNSIDLENELRKNRKLREGKEIESTLSAFRTLLQDIDRMDSDIEREIRSISGDKGHIVIPSNLMPNNIFHEDDIRELCIDYRLRFLEAQLFKGDIPYEAISKVKALKKDLNGALNGFMVVAPAELFHLKEKDKDPMLFMNLGSGYYYLVHKWGGEVNAWRKLLSYPFRSFAHMVFTIFSFVLLVSLLIPSSVTVPPGESSAGIRIVFFFWLLLSTMGMTVFFSFSFGAVFSEMSWRSKYRPL